MWRFSIFMAVIDALGDETRKTILAKGVGDIDPGPSAPATRYEDSNAKRNKPAYKEIDFSKYEYVPFVLTSQGAFGATAKSFLKLLSKKIRERSTKSVQKASDPADLLKKAISLEVQRQNAIAVLNNHPQSENATRRREYAVT